MDSSQEAQILLCVPHVQLCRVQDDLTQLLESIEMNFAKLPNGYVFFSIGQHFFTLQKSVPIYLTAYQTQRSYCYSFIGEIHSIILQDSECQLQYEAIDKLFDTYALLVVKDRQGNQFQDGGQVMPVTPPPKSAWTILTDGASSLGSTISKGIVDGGQFVASGITSIGDYIESKVSTSSEPVKISDKTKENVRMIKNTSGKALEVTGTIVKQIIEMNLRMAQMMASTVVEVTGLNKNKDKETQEISPKKQEMNHFAESTLLATLGVLDSLDKAAEQVGTAIGQSATRIIQKKYGKDASDLFNEGVDVVGNVGKTYRDIKQAEIKAITRATAKQAIIEVKNSI